MKLRVIVSLLLLGAIVLAPSRAADPAPLNDVELWIGGEQAVIDYAGAAPGDVGLMQINTRMIAAMGRVLVVLKVGDKESAIETVIFGK